MRFDLKVGGAVGLDAGTLHPWICKGIIERGLYGVMGYHRPATGRCFHKRRYAYDPQTDSYRCPAGRSSSIVAPTGWAIGNTPRTQANAASTHSAPAAPRARTTRSSSPATSGSPSRNRSTPIG